MSTNRAQIQQRWRAGLFASRSVAGLLCTLLTAPGHSLHQHRPNAVSRSSEPAASSPRLMRKAILLNVTVDVQLWVEAKEAPSHDYAKSTVQAIDRMIAEAASRQQHLHVTILGIHEHEEP
jgi:hypothetical protein